jgi:hypothetical protein
VNDLVIWKLYPMPAEFEQIENEFQKMRPKFVIVTDRSEVKERQKSSTEMCIIELEPKLLLRTL